MSLFITFEGISGSGKATQSSLLKEHFIKNSKKVIKITEP